MSCWLAFVLCTHLGIGHQPPLYFFTHAVPFASVVYKILPAVSTLSLVAVPRCCRTCELAVALYSSTRVREYSKLLCTLPENFTSNFRTIRPISRSQLVFKFLVTFSSLQVKPGFRGNCELVLWRFCGPNGPSTCTVGSLGLLLGAPPHKV